MVSNKKSSGRKTMRLAGLTYKLIIIMKNYRKIVINFLYFLSFFLFISIISLVITFPLWFAATNYSKSYSVLVVSVIVLAAIFLGADRMKKWVNKKKKFGLTGRAIILIPVRKTAAAILFLSALYLIVFLFSRNLALPAILLSILYLLVFGYYFFIRNQQTSPGQTPKH